MLIVFFCSVGVGSYYLTHRRSYQNYPEVAKLLAHQVNESDLILVHSVPCGVAGVARYLEKAGASKTGVRFASWVGQLGQRRVPEDLEASRPVREGSFWSRPTRSATPLRNSPG